MNRNAVIPEFFDLPDVDACRLKKSIRQRLPSFGKAIVEAQFCFLEYHASGERVTIAMQARAAEPQHNVPRTNGGAIEDVRGLAPYRAKRGAYEIEHGWSVVGRGE